MRKKRHDSFMNSGEADMAMRDLQMPYRGQSKSSPQKFSQSGLRPMHTKMKRMHKDFGDIVSGIGNFLGSVAPIALSFLNEGGKVGAKRKCRSKHAAGAVAKIRKGQY